MKQNLIPFMDINRFPRLFSTASLFDDRDWPWQRESDFGLSISEDDNAVYIEAALPGIDPQQVEVTFEKGLLWIRGEVKDEEKDNRKQYYRKTSQSFSYRTAVRDTVDESSEPNVVGKNGMVTVTFAKSAKSTPKKLKVKTE